MAVRHLVAAFLALLVVAPPAPARQRRFRNYTGDDGLSQLVVQALIQDAAGRLWIGTQAGLDVFDGAGFRSFGLRHGLPSDRIADLVVDLSGRVWVATTQGVAVSDGGRFRAFDLPSVRWARCLAIDARGRILCGTREGLRIIDDGVVRLPDGPAQVRGAPINDLLVDGSGRVWVATDAGLFVGDAGSRFVPVGTIGKERAVTALAEEPKVGVWAAFPGLVLCHGPGGEIAGLIGPEEGLEGSVAALLRDRSGNLWIGGENGLQRAADGRVVERLREEEGLPFSSIRTLLEDREGMLWVGGFGGLSKFVGRAFTSYTVEDGLGSSNLRPIVRDRQGVLWVGTLDGLSRFDGETWTTFREAEGLACTGIWSLLEDDEGTLWIGTREGLFTFDGTSFRRDATIDARLPVVHLVKDTRSVLWCSVRNVGLFRRGEAGFEQVEVPDQTFLDARILVDREGRIWASGDRGLSCLVSGRWQLLTTEQGLAGNDPYFLCEDRSGRIWFGYHSSRGLTSFNGDRFLTYTTSEGLFNDTVYSIGADRVGNLWVGTARGVDRFDGIRFTHFGTAEGYASNESNAGGFLADDDGTLWFATAGGLSHFDPRYDPSLGPSPSVLIEDIVLGNRSHTLPLGVVAAPQGTTVRVHVAVLSSVNEKALAVRYRIPGYRESWSPVVGRDVDLGTVPAGEYNLEIQARKYSQEWSEPTRLALRLTLPFWRTPGFVVLLVVFALLGFGLVYRVRVLSIKARNRRLEELVEERTEALSRQKSDLELTQTELEETNRKLQDANRLKGEFLANVSHEIRTPINGILGMTAITMESELTTDQREYLSMVRSSADSLLAVINDVLDLSKIEAGKLDLEDVDFDLRRVLGDTAGSVGFAAHRKRLDLVCHVDPEVPGIVRGDPTRLRQIVLNLLSNAIKFTDEGEVVVRVSVDERDSGRDDLSCPVRFQVRDTGIGIPLDRQTSIFEAFSQADGSTTRKYGGTGLGLTISATLVSLMGGRIGVRSEPGRGTTFDFTVRLRCPSDQRRMRSFASLDGLSVLVLEDNASARDMLAETLRGFRMRPVVARNLEEAQMCLDREAERGAGFSVSLIDGDLEDEEGGPVLRRLEEHGEVDRLGVRILLVTADARQAFSSLRSEGIFLLGKPTDPSSLLDVLLNALDPTIPRVTREESPAAVTASKSLRLRLRVLLAEDNPVNQRVAVHMLRSLGHEVLVAETGHQALDILSGEDVDIVLMDVQMPEMDGLTAVQRIRRKEMAGGRRLPVIALTAHAMRGDREKCMDAGMDDYLSKPFRRDDLRKMIERWGHGPCEMA